MLKVGLTGNLGSGKTTVARIFQTLGVPVYHADEASKSFLSYPSVKEKIIRSFGAIVMKTDGEIDRRILGNLVFSDPQSLALLNSILHPLVREDSRKWSSLHAEYPYIIHEAAIIYESGFQDEYDRIIHISCPLDIAVPRAMKRDKVSREETLSRTRFQWNDEEKARLADYVIINDGTELVIPRVFELHRVLIEQSAVSSQQSTVDQ